MPEADRLFLQGIQQSQLENFGYRVLLDDIVRAVGIVGNDTAAFSLAAQGHANAAAGSLAAALLITGGSVGIGSDTLELPRVADLGGSAFLSPDLLDGKFPENITTARTLTFDDWGRVIVAESGTLTLTLPLLATLRPGWFIEVWNRSGANLTVSRQGTADVIGAASATVTIANNTGGRFAYGSPTRFERIG